MTDELYSLRVIVASESQDDRDMFRQAAGAATVPIDLAEADGAASASRLMLTGADLAFFDIALGEGVIARMTSTARAAAKPPFTVLLNAPDTTASFATDALASKPADLAEAIRLVSASIRVRLPTRVLIVDDSPTMRSIVRKILAATRFPLHVTEAEMGGEAIELVRQSPFDIAFIDQHLPGFSGLETIAELRRTQRHLVSVLITSANDETVMARARSQGAGFLKKPFFPADMEAVLCEYYGLRALNPRRA
jgi:CheY-like chemotaxis protein